MTNSVFVLAPGEDWIVDRFVQEWNNDNNDIVASSPSNADVVWLLADWTWRRIDASVLRRKKVITTVHHIVPEKFSQQDVAEFAARDDITDVYHVPNFRTLHAIHGLTKKPIHLIPYWANQRIWFNNDSRQALRAKYDIPIDAYVIGSFQRDTEGRDLISPKLEKGPDLFVDFVEQKWRHWNNSDLRAAGEPKKPYVVLAGWRRQYVMSRLRDAQVPFKYIERPQQCVLNDLYQTLDLYPVTSRYEGGPQSLIECGLLGIACVSRPVGIAEQVLPKHAIADNVAHATPVIPAVEHLKLPHGYKPYRDLIESI